MQCSIRAWSKPEQAQGIAREGEILPAHFSFCKMIFKRRDRSIKRAIPFTNRNAGRSRLLLLFSRFLLRTVGGARLGIQAVSWIFVQDFARDVRPELLEDGAEPALGSHNHPVGEGLTYTRVAGRIVEIGDRAGDDVARHIGVVGLLR